MTADRSAWIIHGLMQRKPGLRGELSVRRRADGGYRIDVTVEGERLPVAELKPAGTKEHWIIQWTSGNGVFLDLDDQERDLNEALDAIARDDFGCFLG